MGIKDNFSKQSATYAKYRPHYPLDLYQYLYSRIKGFGCVWDCATGNGQVATQLAKQFEQVIATDISSAQLSNAVPANNITYDIAPAESTSIASHSIDLITVGQAIHWFDHEPFYKEVQRVANQYALLAYWSYGSFKTSSTIEKAIKNFHSNTVGDYWDPERKIWENEYKEIDFKLKGFERKDFKYKLNWDISHLEGYLNSWSAVQHYIKKEGDNPVIPFIEELKHEWDSVREVVFPVFLYAGRVV